MSSTPDTITDPDREAGINALASLLRAGRTADRERQPYTDTAIDAARRLAAWCWSTRGQSSQVDTVVRALASVYNGRESRQVRLDELRWLDWTQQRDLIAVIFGTGQTGTEDTHIRCAFAAAGGEAAVDWFHSHLDAGTSDTARRERIETTADKVRRRLTDAARDHRSEHGTDYLDTAPKSRINQTIADTIEASALS